MDLVKVRSVLAVRRLYRRRIVLAVRQAGVRRLLALSPQLARVLVHFWPQLDKGRCPREVSQLVRVVDRMAAQSPQQLRLLLGCFLATQNPLLLATPAMLPR